MTRSRADLLQGSLDLLILKTLAVEPLHEWGVSKRIQLLSRGTLEVNQGSLYPARDHGGGWMMSGLKWFMRRLRVLLDKQSIEDEMDAEMRFHLEMEIQQHVRAGVDPAEARRRALVAFGGVERHKEEVRDVRGARILDDLLQDTRIALRHFGRQHGSAGGALHALNRACSQMALGASARKEPTIGGEGGEVGAHGIGRPPGEEAVAVLVPLPPRTRTSPRWGPGPRGGVGPPRPLGAPPSRAA